MKARTITLLSITLLTLMLIGAIVVEVGSAPPRVRVKGKFYPRTWTTGLPDPWICELGFAPKRSVDELNLSTICINGVPISGFDEAPYDRKNRAVLPFRGWDVMAAIMSQIMPGHMTPTSGAHLVTLEVTGELNDEAHTPFSTGGSSVVVVFIDDVPAPP